MKRKSNLGMDKTQPALLVQHGNTAQKHRPLDRAAVSLGQARGCDIELDAPEVSSIHCIITRGPNGLYIRDCNSRMGTRINGERVREGFLHDADILQVGPFSFQVYVPPSFATQPEKGPSMSATADSPAEQSGKSVQLETESKVKEAELQQLEESLQKQQEDLEQKEKQLEDSAKQLAANRQAMQEEAKKAEAHARKREEDLKQKQAKTEEEIQARLKECQQKCADMERNQAEALKSQTVSAAAAPESSPSPEKHRELDIRQQELDKFAKHLLSLQERLREQEEKLRQGIVPQAAPAVGDEFKQSQQEILSKVSQQQESVVQLQQSMERKYDELIGVLSELKDAQTATQDQQGQGIEMLRQTSQLLQTLAARRDQAGAAAPLPVPEPAPPTPGPEPKGRDKLAERLRAIDAKIPSVGSRQSRHD
jgi:pSer/pThr/pTyr-binding forkhead associated (FHA) protein